MGQLVAIDWRARWFWQILNTENAFEALFHCGKVLSINFPLV